MSTGEHGPKSKAGINLRTAFKPLKYTGNLLRFTNRHRKGTAVALAVTAIGGITAGELHDTSTERYEGFERHLVSDGQERGASCFTRGLLLHAGVTIRKTPGSVGNWLGPLSSITGVMEGNEEETIEVGEAKIIKQPSITRGLEGNDLAIFTSSQLSGSTKTNEQIASVTYSVDMGKFSHNDTFPSSKYGSAITAFSLAGSTENGRLAPCSTEESGQTLLNGQEAAYAVNFSNRTFENLQR